MAKTNNTPPPAPNDEQGNNEQSGAINAAVEQNEETLEATFTAERASGLYAELEVSSDDLQAQGDFSGKLYIDFKEAFGLTKGSKVKVTLTVQTAEATE